MAVVSLVSVFVLWIVILNVALWSGFVARSVTGTYRMSAIELEYGFAWTVWPTRVHVEDLELRIDAYRYQLELVVPEGEVDIALWELLARRFHARSIVADGAQAKFRSKSPPGRVSEERFAAFPEIEGMTDPVRWPGPPNLPDEEHAWEVWLETVDGELSSLWVNELNFATLDARLTGAMRSRAGHLFAIDDLAFELRSGEVHVGDELFAKSWSGTVTVDLLDYDPHELVGRSMLAQLNLALDAGADVVSMAALDPFVHDVPLRLRGGQGPLELGIHVQRGVLMPGTEILYRTDEIGIRTGPWRARTGVRLAIGVDAPAEATRARAAAELHDLAIAHGDADRKALSAERIVASVVVGETSLIAEELPIVGGDLRVPKLAIHDLGALDGISEKLDLRGGKGELALHSRMTKPGRLRHEASVKLSGVNVRLPEKRLAVRAGVELSADVRTDTKLRKGESDEIALTVRDLSLRTKHGESNDGWVQVKRGSVAWNAKKKSIDARLYGRLDDLRPILSHVDDRERVVELVPDLDVTEPLDFDVELHKDAKVVDVRVRRLERPALDIEGVVHVVGKRSRSAFRLRRANLGLVRDEARQREIDAGANEAWLQQRIRWARELGQRRAEKAPRDRRKPRPTRKKTG